jgi:transcriptional regulator with XRE-family HTH domain
MTDTVTKLRKLAKTKTQAEAARVLHLTRGRVSQIAGDERIKFRHLSRPKHRTPRVCNRCRVSLNGRESCLRCKWTPARIKRLRKSLGLSQVAMSIEKLRRNVWCVQRWERGVQIPSRESLQRLEALERSSQR